MMKGVIHTGKTILQDISIPLLLAAILIMIFICYVGIIWNHRVLKCKDILDIVNGREAKMKRSGRPKVMAAVGLVLVVIGNLILLIDKIIWTKEPSDLVPLISTVITVCGVYLSVFSFGYWFPAVMGYRDKSRKSLLLINEIRSYYRNDAKALAAYAIMNWINIFLIVVIVLLWEENISMDFSDSPYDYVLEFAEQRYDDMTKFMNQNEDVMYARHILKSLEGITDGGWEVVLIQEADYNDDFRMAAQHGLLQYKLCVNLVEGGSLELGSSDEKIQPVHITGRQEHFMKMQRENNILIISLDAMLAVINIILLFTQFTLYCSGRINRKRDAYIQLTLGIKEGANGAITPVAILLLQRPFRLIHIVLLASLRLKNFRTLNYGASYLL